MDMQVSFNLVNFPVDPISANQRISLSPTAGKIAARGKNFGFAQRKPGTLTGFFGSVEA
jgi:hypothetical protein